MASNETTAKLSVDISELKKGIQDANRQIRLANAEFKSASSSMDDWGKSADGISKKIEQLEKVLSAQKTILDTYKKQLSAIVEAEGENSKGADEMRIKIANQEATVNNTAKELEKYKTTLKGVEDGTIDLAEAEEKTIKTTENANDGYTVLKGTLANLASSAIKACVDGFKKLATSAYDAWKAYDEGLDTITRLTGASGEMAESLKESFSTVSKGILADSKDIGSAIGEINTRYGLTGEKLEELSNVYLKFANITGSDVISSIDETQKALSAYGLTVNDAESFLNRLAYTAQATGVQTSTLSNGIIQNAVAFQELGLDINQAVEFMGQLEKSGSNSETVMNGMRKALKNASQDGKDLGTALMELQNEILNSNGSTQALNDTYDLFGKSGDQIFGAIKNGSLSFEGLTESIANADGTISTTYENTLDATDKINLAIQNAKTSVGELFAEFLGDNEEKINEFLTKLTEEYIPNLISGGEWLLNNLPQIASNIGAVVAGFIAFKTALGIAGLITGLIGAWKAYQIATEGATLAQFLLNKAMNANPIGIIIALIAGLVTAFITLWNTSEEFRAFWIELWDNIKTFVGNAIDGVVGFFTDMWANIREGWRIIKNGIASIPTWFFNTLIKPVTNFVGNMWSNVKNGAKNAWEGIKTVFGKVAEWFENIFSKAWKKVKDVFSTGGKVFDGIKDGIVSVFKTVVNAIIRGINKVISIPFNAINGVLSKIKNVKIAGFKPFENLISTINTPQIPELENGGILKRGQVGLLEGNGAEAVVPLDKNKKWIRQTANTFKKMLERENGVAGFEGFSKNVTVNNNYNYVQNNTSPKALSRLEIYRQTRNQLSFYGQGV